MLLSMEYVTREIQYYNVFEVLYFGRKTSDAAGQLRGALLDAYAKLQGWLAKAKRYFASRTLSEFHIHESQRTRTH